MRASYAVGWLSLARRSATQPRSQFAAGDSAHLTSGAALNAAAPHIQRAVGSQTRLKYTPKLQFSVDPSIDHGLKIDRLLRDIDQDPEAADG